MTVGIFDRLLNKVICLEMLDLEFQIDICPTVFYMMFKFGITKYAFKTWNILLFTIFQILTAMLSFSEMVVTIYQSVQYITSLKNRVHFSIW